MVLISDRLTPNAARTAARLWSRIFIWSLPQFSPTSSATSPSMPSHCLLEPTASVINLAWRPLSCCLADCPSWRSTRTTVGSLSSWQAMSISLLTCFTTEGIKYYTEILKPEFDVQNSTKLCPLKGRYEQGFCSGLQSVAVEGASQIVMIHRLRSHTIFSFILPNTHPVSGFNVSSHYLLNISIHYPRP